MFLFQYGFMFRAFLAALGISVIAPMLGVFLVIRRQSLMADTLSHISLAGVALGLFLHINSSLTTFFVVILAAILLEYLRMLYKTYSEVATAILMSGGLALALVLTSHGKVDASMNIQQYLFGSIVTIDWLQVKVLMILFVILLAAFLLFKRQMYVLTFDEATAFVDGLPVKWMSIAFNVGTGIAVAVMIPIAGALLVSAIMILPAAIGMRIGKSFTSVIFLSMFIGMIGMILGLYASFYLDAPSGASITLVFILLFLGSNLVRMIWIGLLRKLSNSE
ncbi:MAG: metal ABC transporter permease [Lactobacillales bacterium]|jgi:zinc transport system permease protein|nr:metal ABC transporter permease [Lactobacillales bacterium]